MTWPIAERLETERFVLEPLRIEHAVDMVTVLAEPLLYRFMGGGPPTLAELRRRYTVQARGHSEDGSEWWFNWVIRSRSSGQLLGFVQATVEHTTQGLDTDIAWVVSTDQQGRGVATEAARAMVAWLREHDVTAFTAHIHPRHHASKAVASKLNLIPTKLVVDGEIRWELPVAGGSA